MREQHSCPGSLVGQLKAQYPGVRLKTRFCAYILGPPTNGYRVEMDENEYNGTIAFCQFFISQDTCCQNNRGIETDMKCPGNEFFRNKPGRSNIRDPCTMYQAIQHRQRCYQSVNIFPVDKIGKELLMSFSLKGSECLIQPGSIPACDNDPCTIFTGRNGSLLTQADEAPVTRTVLPFRSNAFMYIKIAMEWPPVQ